MITGGVPAFNAGNDWNSNWNNRYDSDMSKCPQWDIFSLSYMLYVGVTGFHCCLWYKFLQIKSDIFFLQKI